MVKSKWLSFVLVFAMLVSMFVPMGMTKVFATGTTYTSVTVPSVSDDGTRQLGSFSIEIDPLYAGQKSEAWIELPQNYEIHRIAVTNTAGVKKVVGLTDEQLTLNLTDSEKSQAFTNAGSVSGDVYSADNPTTKVATFTVSNESKRGFKLTLDSVSASEKVRLLISFDEVKVPSGASGDIQAAITNISGQLVSGSVAIATVGSGDLTVEAIDTDSFSDAGGYVEIRLAESAAGKLNARDEFKLELPDGFEWGNVENTVLGETYSDRGAKIVYGNLGNSDNLTLKYDDKGNVVGFNEVNFVSDGDTLKVYLTSDTYKSKSKVAIDFWVPINVTDTSKAKEGDVVAKVKGDYDVTPSEITVGTYGDYGVSIKAEDSSTVALAGQNDQGVSDITIKESIKGSLIDGRSILITLPSNARWYKIDDTKVNEEKNEIVDSDNGVELRFAGLQGTDNRTAKFIVEGSSDNSTDPAELKIENLSVALDTGVTGDLVATVSGSQGLTGDITLAKVVNPVKVTADKANVKLGVSDQAAGDITISEYQDGAIDTNDGDDPIRLNLPDGVKFSSKPTVDVTAGDIEVDRVSLANDDSTLEIYFKDDSNTASTIKISNIKYDVDRTVGEGDIQVKVGGDALVTVPYKNLDNYKNNDDYATLDYADIYFSGNDYITKAANATVVTPAPSATKQTAVFTINSTTYTVNGVQNTLDSAPYVKNGRTYLPTRYVAYALGVSSDNVLWDGTKATFILGNRVVQVTPGSTTLTINGAPVTMDAPAEIVNGRVMVPFRWIAQAFGAQVQWDATNQTVTMTLQAQ